MKVYRKVVRDVSKKTKVPIYIVDKIVREFLNDVVDQVVEGETITLPSVGVFTTIITKPKKVRNFGGDLVDVKVHRKVKFKLNRAFRDAVRDYEKKEKEIDYDEEGFD